ncbi:MAG: hypothetical protein RL354_2582 [Planctomycetota bacterium]
MLGDGVPPRVVCEDGVHQRELVVTHRAGHGREERRIDRTGLGAHNRLDRVRAERPPESAACGRLHLGNALVVDEARKQRVGA